MVSKDSPRMEGEEGPVPTPQMCSALYACPSCFPALSRALHRMGLGRKMLSASPAPMLCPVTSSWPPCHPSPPPHSLTMVLSLAQFFSPADPGQGLKGEGSCVENVLEEVTQGAGPLG